MGPISVYSSMGSPMCRADTSSTTLSRKASWIESWSMSRLVEPQDCPQTYPAAQTAQGLIHTKPLDQHVGLEDVEHRSGHERAGQRGAILTRAAGDAFANDA